MAWRRSRISIAAARLSVVAVIAWSAGTCTDTVVAPVDVALVEVTPEAVRVTAGDTVRVSAVLKDGTGNQLPGRQVTWSSSDQDVATVDQGGLVRGVDRGIATVTADWNGVAGSATIEVDAAPVIILGEARVDFSAVAGGDGPPVRTISVTNGGDSALTGLAAVVTYGSSAGGWLEAMLNETAAPATLTLRARPGDLVPGTYVATVQVSSPVAVNSPRPVSVTFELAEPEPDPDPPPPAVPQELRVTLESTRRIELAWDHDGTGVATYRLARRKDESGGGWEDVATISAPALAYADTGLDSATSYLYRIRACDAADLCSDYSNQVTGRTLGG